MDLELVNIAQSMVALRKESVDRNMLCLSFPVGAGVALRKESVDRNVLWVLRKVPLLGVALRKESVDRNSSWKLV